MLPWFAAAPGRRGDEFAGQHWTAAATQATLGRVGRTIGSEATGSAFSFATTYALGHVAKRYYADGRRLDGAALKAAFGQLFDNAKGLQQRYAPEIAERARTLDLKKLTGELTR